MTDPLIDQPMLRDVVLRTTEKLRNNPTGGVIRPSVDSRLIRNVSAEAWWEQSGTVFRVQSDEAPGRGGRGEHPTAIRYFLAGISFCLQVWYAKAAALAGVVLDDVQLNLEMAIDMRVEYGLPPAPGPEHLIATTRIRSSASTDEVRGVAEEAHARCPLAQLVGRSVPIYVRVVHNGDVLLDQVPQELSKPPSD
jgi:organic hydroperoxide reductase OsmC/OhrA